MEFSDLSFLSYMLPLIGLGYFLIPDVGRRNILLIAVSLLLYAVNQPLYAVLLLVSCHLNFRFGLKVKRGQPGTLVAPLVWNVGLLLVLKYLDPVLVMAGLGSGNAGPLLGLVGRAVQGLNSWGIPCKTPDTLAPLGISFYTLTALSYLLDVYRGKHPPERSMKAFLLYMVLFPKLFQGPLVRYEQVATQLKERRSHYRQAVDGMVRFAAGLGKKVLLADACGEIITELVAVKSDQALVGSWLLAVLYFFQIYYDFSGSCDMAIGLGRIFGFRFPENFSLPYTALSVTEFCQRWNLTLTTFFRDYVYDPICKKRAGAVRKFVALLMCSALMGVWHGAGFGFLLWALYLMTLILIEKVFDGFLTDLPYFLRHVLTVLALLVGWVIFRNPDMTNLGDALKAMIGNGGLNVTGDGERLKNAVALIGACWIGVTSLPRKFRRYWRSFFGVAGKQGREQTPVMRYGYLISCGLYIVILLWWCIAARIGRELLPSIYMNL